MIKDKHTLPPKYLLINYAWSLVLFAISLLAWHDDSLFNTDRGHYYIAVITTGLLLFPSPRFYIEKIALQFSTKKLLTSGFFQDDAGQNGVCALFYLFCIVMAIPFGLGYLFYRGIQKCGLVRPHKIG